MRHLIVVLSCAVVLGACSSPGSEPAETADATTARTVQPGAPGEPSRVLTPEEVAELDLAIPDLTDADVAFLQGMIPHHEQALRMTGLVDDRRADSQLSLFAERMDISQREEIDLMTEWLRDVDATVLGPDDHGDGHGDGHHGSDLDVPMMGMLTEDELETLEAADGETFDRLFLTSMIQHHQGALAMVEQLYDDGGGLHPDLAQFANHVASDQNIEIARMRSMLEDGD